MATATSTITPSLTPSQQAAREFWRQAGADGMPPFYVMSQYYAQLSANSDNLPAVTAALEQLLTGLGYATDVDTVFAELTAGQGEELGYWAGRYCLFDSDGNRFDLVVGRDGATLTVPPALVDVTSLPAGTDMASVTVLSSVGFSDSVLQLANANALLPREISLVRLQASLSFSLPVSDATLDTGAAAFQSTAPLCKGTFVVSGAGSAGLRPVNGKRGAWTQAGVNQAADGDPAAAWYGQYVLLEVTDVTAVKQDPNPVYIYNDPDPDPSIGGLTFQWGQDGDPNAKYSGKVTYNNNVLQCPDDSDPDTQYAMQFIAPQAGAAEINLTVTTQGAVRSYKGYWVDRCAPPSPTSPTSQARLATRPMTAVYSAASDASAGGYSQPIDVSSLTPDPKPNKVVLPYGAVGNTYALSLNLTGCADSDKFSWTLKPGSSKNDVTNRAVITASGATTAQFTLANLSDSDTNQQLLVTVQLTNNSAAPPVTYTLQFDIPVIQCDAISLAPTVLMPVVVGTAYTQNLVAHGARDDFTWSVNDKSLPPGLMWDDSSQQLSGTVTDAAQVGKAFSLVVELAASDVIMDPLTVSLGITVQSAPAVASDMPPWEKIFIYAMTASGVVMLALAAFAINRYRAAKNNNKTDDAVNAGKTNVEKKGDPKKLSESIVQADQAKLATVEGNIPDVQNLLDGIKQQLNDVMAEVAKNQAKITELRKYVNDPAHKRDEWSDPVTDEDLAKDYPEYGDVLTALKELTQLNKAKIQELSTAAEWSNKVTSNNTSDTNKIADANNSKSNDNSLDKV
jgi:hypothetical protein